MRYFFEVSYKGTNYHGWQVQKNAISIQEVIEKSLETILQEKTGIIGSGRTDTGVHCRQQYFHADINDPIDLETLRFKLNSFLPVDIAINSIHKVRDDAHARFDAVSRSYIYYINRNKNPFITDTSCFLGKDLNIPTMNAATSLLIGEHNFESFSKVKTDVSNFICTITEAKWQENNSNLEFHITANRFLRGMVRAIVGTVLEVGKGKINVEDFNKIIENRDRKSAGAAAPPQGLFLSKVLYPEEIFLKD